MRFIEENIVKTAEIIKVLGHPVRIEILRLLAASKGQKLTVSEIQEGLEIPQPEASKHLIAMKNKLILTAERKDGFSWYKINEQFPFIRSIINFINKK